MRRCPPAISTKKGGSIWIKDINELRTSLVQHKNGVEMIKELLKLCMNSQVYLPFTGVNTDLVNVEIWQVSLQHISKKLSFCVMRTICFSCVSEWREYYSIKMLLIVTWLTINIIINTEGVWLDENTITAINHKVYKQTDRQIYKFR